MRRRRRKEMRKKEMEGGGEAVGTKPKRQRRGSLVMITYEGERKKLGKKFKGGYEDDEL